MPLVIIVVAIGAVVLVAWIKPPPPTIPAVQSPPVNVEVLQVSAIEELADTFRLTAVVEPYRVVQVAAEVSGRVERWGTREQPIALAGREIPAGTTINEGEPIATGDTIVQLNDDLLQARYDREAAQLDYDQREYERIRALYERGSTASNELDNQVSQRDIARANLNEAARALERATIVAPISGILNDIMVEVGEYASPGTPVAEIVEIDRVKVVVDVPERDIYYLALGQQATINAQAADAAEQTGKITYISELADSQTRTTHVEITVDNHDRLLRSGQIVRVSLTRQMLADVIMIPLAAVIPLEEGKVVYVVNADNQAERREVELGFIKGRDVQILSGLAPGDILIIAGHRYVGPGQAVAIIEGE
ncbi:MAG: efflux RND transporter periplasmic adaptor subunit [Phycisphaerae bacterium]|nr:efflux RND transporter periplasmic adaptor subunit [Phycisphaerae bacterium]